MIIILFKAVKYGANKMKQTTSKT